MKISILLLSLLAATCAFGQGQNTPCPANLALCGTPLKVAQLAAYTGLKGTMAVVSDGISSSDCTVGGGSTMVTCQTNGTGWSQSGGGTGPGTSGPTPSVMQLEENFCGGTNTSGNITQLSWELQSIGSAPVLGANAGTWPYLCQFKFQTAAAATQNQGGIISLSAIAGGQVWADFSTNTNWSMTLIFQLGSVTSDVFYFGLEPGTPGVPRNSSIITIRHDTNSPVAAAAITAATCNTTFCTITTGTTSTLVGQAMTITGATCPTHNINGTFTTTYISGGTFRFNQAGANDGACSVAGTVTSSAETTFKFVAQNTNTTTSTVVDSGITADTNWHKIRIYSTVSGTVNFALDANAPVSINTNVTTTPIQPSIVMITDTAAQKSVILNYFNFYMTGLTR